MLVHFPDQLIGPQSVDEIIKPGWIKTAGGKINGIPDLPESMLIVQIARFLKPFGEINEAVERIRRQIRVDHIEVTFSREVRLIYFQDEDEYDQYPPSYGRLDARMRILADDNGYPIYIYRFPQSLESVNKRFK